MKRAMLKVLTYMKMIKLAKFHQTIKKYRQMTRLFKISIFLLGVFALISLGACSDDIDPEITEVSVSRLFSPVDLKVRIANQTSARLTWKAVRKANSYEIQVFDNNSEDYSGTPLKDIKGVTMGQQPFVIPGFDGDTTYSLRIRALGDGIGESSWMSTTFKTDPEQIFKKIEPEDLGAKSVTLKWTAGEEATNITLNPGNVNRVLTPDELENGEVTFTGLMGETEYTAILKNGSKTRGTAIFTTLIDLDGAIQINPEDDLKAVIEAAEDGDVLALFPGEYLVGTGSVDITKNISIVAAFPTDKPVLHSRFILSGTGNLEFNISNLILSGFTVVDGAVTENRDTYVLDLTNGAEFATVRLSNIEVIDFQRSLLRGTSGGGDIQNFIVENSLIYRTTDGNNEFIDLRSGRVQNISLLNSTFANVASTRMFMRADDIAGFENQKVLIEKCTFYNVGLPSAIWLRVRTVTPYVTVRKNIFVNLGSGENVVGDNSDINDNNYVEAAAISGFDSSAKAYDPNFVDAENYNFTVQEEEVIFGEYGDSRWR